MRALLGVGIVELPMSIGDADLSPALVVNDLSRPFFRFDLAVRVSAHALVVLFDDIPSTALFVRDDVAITVVFLRHWMLPASTTELFPPGAWLSWSYKLL